MSFTLGCKVRGLNSGQTGEVVELVGARIVAVYWHESDMEELCNATTIQREE